MEKVTDIKTHNMSRKHSEILPVKGYQNRAAGCYIASISDLLKTSNERSKGEVIEGYRGPAF